MRWKLSCPLCECAGFDIVSKAYYLNRTVKDQVIVLCRCCGYVYKIPPFKDHPPEHYTDPRIWDSAGFNEKYQATVQFLAENVDKKNARVLEVGCGDGSMLKMLKKERPGWEMVAIEQSKEAHRAASKCLRGDAVVINDSFDNVDIPHKAFDLVLMVGVDYFFPDRIGMHDRIGHALTPNGQWYVERNVFLGMKAFVGKRVKTAADLFGSNSMIIAWPTEKLYSNEIRSHWKIDHLFSQVQRERDIESRQVGYLCSEDPVLRFEEWKTYRPEAVKELKKLGVDID